MLATTIHRVYKHHGKAFRKDVKNARTLEEKGIHRLRLNIKAIIVLLGLMAVISNKKLRGKILLKLLRPIFKKAGKLRTTTLNLKLTHPYRSAVLQKFKAHLAKKQERQRQKLLKEIRKLPLKKISKLHKKNLAAFRKRESDDLPQNVLEHLRELLAGVRADLFDINNDETLHEIRRQLKTIRNIGQLLTEAKVDHPFTEEIQKITDTYDKLGAWHDTVELLKELENFVDNLHEPAGLEKTIPLILKLKKESLKNKRQIAKKLRSDLVRP
jgi:hypothetical protein